MGFEQLFEPSRLLTFFFLVIRMGGIFFTAPIFSSSVLSAQVRMILTLIVSFLMLSIVVPIPVADAADPNILWIILTAFKEVMIGVTIGAMTSLLFSALQLGGYLVDYQMGFSMVNVMDPSSNASISFTGQVYNIMATLIYLSLNGHHIFLRAVAQSFDYLPLANFEFKIDGLMFVLLTFTKVFIVAMQITAPIFIALMVTNAVMGVMARLVPQINLMVVGFPIKIGLGAIVLIMSLQLFYVAFEKVMFEYFRQIMKFFEIMGS